MRTHGLISLLIPAAVILIGGYTRTAYAQSDILTVHPQPGTEVRVEVPFLGGFQPDCDGDANLTVADFSCFLQKFAESDSYTNADGSVQRPVWNVADFTAYLQSFANGRHTPVQVLAGSIVGPRVEIAWNECICPQQVGGNPCNGGCIDPSYHWVGLPPRPWQSTAPRYGAGGWVGEGYWYAIIAPDPTTGDVVLRCEYPTVITKVVMRPFTIDWPLPYGLWNLIPPAGHESPWWDVQWFWPRGTP